MATKKDKVEVRSDKMKTVMESISRPFDQEKIQERKVQGGKSANYVKSQEYIARLNEIFGVSWTLEIIQHWLANNQLMMWVRITYPDPDNPERLFFKDGIAGHPFAGDAGNAFKSVYSKAVTIAAAKLGIGLHLWGVDVDGEDEAPVWEDYSRGGGSPVPNPMPTGVPTPPPLPTTPTPNTAPPLPMMGGGPVTPNLVNDGAMAPPPMAPVPNMAPPPPIPTGNPTAGVPIPNNVGLTAGPGTPATASLSIPSSGGGGIKDFQINGIGGAAGTRGFSDPMQFVKQLLGPEVAHLTSLEQLTVEQANKVLELHRQLPLS